jgi:hypothetical protein
MTRAKKNGRKVVKTSKHEIIREDDNFVTYETTETRISKIPLLVGGVPEEQLFTIKYRKVTETYWIIKTRNKKTERRKIPKVINAIINERLKEENKRLKAQKTLTAKILRNERTKLLRREENARKEKAMEEKKAREEREILAIVKNAWEERAWEERVREEKAREEKAREEREILVMTNQANSDMEVVNINEFHDFLNFEYIDFSRWTDEDLLV